MHVKRDVPERALQFDGDVWSAVECEVDDGCQFVARGPLQTQPTESVVD